MPCIMHNALLYWQLLLTSHRLVFVPTELSTVPCCHNAMPYTGAWVALSAIDSISLCWKEYNSRCCINQPSAVHARMYVEVCRTYTLRCMDTATDQPRHERAGGSRVQQLARL